ncbi:MAG TPA: hypothetical protein VGZ47_19130 [Gemmataceae bacterium]|jgi:hypothetical protein|nr:hypothetical protein [Gemmataceae bacterium]
MNTKFLRLALIAVVLLTIGRQALAKRVNNDVTPANIDKLPFTATVKVKDAGKLKEFEITIKDIKGKLVNPTHPPSPGGWLELVIDGKAVAAPAVTKVEKGGIITFTFRLTPDQIEGARFAFVEDAEDWSKPFPSNGNYYQFMLKEFVAKPKK